MPQPRSKIEPAAEHVQDRVVIGHDEQPVALHVVAGVDDDGQVTGRQDRLEALGELRPAGPTGQDRRRGSPVAPSVQVFVDGPDPDHGS